MRYGVKWYFRNFLFFKRIWEVRGKLCFRLFGLVLFCFALVRQFDFILKLLDFIFDALGSTFHFAKHAAALFALDVEEAEVVLECL